MQNIFLNHPFFLGLDDLQTIVHQLARSAEGYPPYNIEILDETTMCITLALAGFSMHDISITQEDNTLVIKGKTENKNESHRCFIHKGIAQRQFSKHFALAQGLEPAGATMDNGMLTITIKHNIQGRVIKHIPITQTLDQKKSGDDT